MLSLFKVMTMKKIILGLIKLITWILIILIAIRMLFLLLLYDFPKYLPKSPPTESMHKIISDQIVLESLIKGTSIKHGITKVFDENGHLKALSNYNYGLIQETIYFQTLEEKISKSDKSINPEMIKAPEEIIEENRNK